MELFLCENVLVKLVEKTNLSHSPRLFLDTRRLTVSHGNRFDFEEEKRNSIGSMETWLEFEDCDEIGFDKETKNLRFIHFKYPERTKPLSNDRLSAIKRISASLELLSHETNFSLIPFSNKFYSYEHGKIISYSDNFLTSDNVLEVEINNEVSLYFQEKKYSGWSIKNPEIHLSDFNWEISNDEINDELKNIFHELLHLTDENNIKRMDDGDPILLEELKKIYSKSKNYSNNNNSKCSHIMTEWILNLADVFYDNEKKNHFGLN